jgi:hypothetical protein
MNECHPIPPPKWWAEAVARWKDMPLPNLKKLMLDSAYACADKHCAPLELAFTTFFSNAHIDALTFKHLQDSCLVERPDFTPFHAKPKKLHLLITTWSYEYSPDNDIEIRHRHKLFNIDLNTYWLATMQTQLTHLTLHCNTYWGIYPRWQPGDLHFPHLKSLALGKWTIAFDWQIDFITSHSQTLEQLILTSCPILHALRMTPRQINNQWQLRLPGTCRGKPYTENWFCNLRWHIVLSTFRTSLTKLKHFSMGRGPVGTFDFCLRVYHYDEAFEDRYQLRPCIDSSRYAVFDFEYGPAEWLEYDPERRQRIYEKTDGYDSSCWLDRETDPEVRKMLGYPDCLREDQEALDDLLVTSRDRW